MRVPLIRHLRIASSAFEGAGIHTAHIRIQDKEQVRTARPAQDLVDHSIRPQIQVAGMDHRDCVFFLPQAAHRQGEHTEHAAGSLEILRNSKFLVQKID